jgi:hypothetical protein
MENQLNTTSHLRKTAELTLTGLSGHLFTRAAAKLFEKFSASEPEFTDTERDLQLARKIAFKIDGLFEDLIHPEIIKNGISTRERLTYSIDELEERDEDDASMFDPGSHFIIERVFADPDRDDEANGRHRWADCYFMRNFEPLHLGPISIDRRVKVLMLHPNLEDNPLNFSSYLRHNDTLAITSFTGKEVISMAQDCTYCEVITPKSRQSIDLEINKTLGILDRVIEPLAL